ncbi:hypothetical protein MZM54_03635 [[Brevibacterium] frigoritolerans]|nr:hypothetical protein [Peribacillus frigoritolerans]
MNKNETLQMTITKGIKFENVTLNEFNKKYQLQATKDMEIEQFTDYIESKELSYFYASYSIDDVLEAIQEEWDVAEHLKIDYLCVGGLYIAVY